MYTHHNYDEPTCTHISHIKSSINVHIALFMVEGGGGGGGGVIKSFFPDQFRKENQTVKIKPFSFLLTFNGSMTDWRFGLSCPSNNECTASW